MIAFAKSLIIFSCLSTLLSFTACTKFKETVHTAPDSTRIIKENTTNNNSLPPEKVDNDSKKNQSGDSVQSSVPISVNEKKGSREEQEEQNNILDTSELQSRLYFNAVKKNIILDAGESIKIVIYLENKGNETEENVTITVWGFEGKGILEFNETLSKSIDAIAPGQKKTVVFPIKTNPGIEDKDFPLKVSMVKGRSEPSVLEIRATCRSKEKRLYLDICKKSKQNNIAAILKCMDYIKEYKEGPHIQKVKFLLEEARWSEMQRLYKQANEKNKGQLEISMEMEKIYLIHYGLNGKYSKNAARMFHELRDFHQACTVDTYKGYGDFIEKYNIGILSQAVKKRTTLRYWRQRYEKEPGNPHILCQLAQATMAEQGKLGYQEAERLFIKVIELDNDNESAYIELGNILKSRKNWDQCIEYLDQRRPPELEHHRIFYLLGNSYEGKDDQARACSLYSKAIENIEKEIEKKLNGIGQCPYLYNDDKSRAIADIKKNREYLNYLYYRALIYREFLDFKNAKRDFRKIIAIAPGSRQAESAEIYLKGM